MPRTARPIPINKPTLTQLRVTLYRYNGRRNAFKYDYVWASTVYGLTPSEAKARIIRALRAK